MLWTILLAIVIGVVAGGIVKAISASKKEQKPAAPVAKIKDESDADREPGANEWKCPACGKINQNYVGSCSCGQAKEGGAVTSKPVTAASKPVSAPSKRSFAPYTGTGVCDVCNRPLGDVNAYIVPNKVFYASPQYRNYLKNSPFALMMGHQMTDADIDLMERRDQSQGSAVCENCINMFQ